MQASDVVMFLPSLGVGGAERSAILLANELTNRGFRVDVIVATSNVDLASQLSKKIGLQSFGRQRVVLSIPDLVSYLNSFRPKALLSFMAHANAAAILASRLSCVSTKVYVCERTSLSAMLKAVQIIRFGGTERQRVVDDLEIRFGIHSRLLCVISCACGHNSTPLQHPAC